MNARLWEAALVLVLGPCSSACRILDPGERTVPQPWVPDIEGHWVVPATVIRPPGKWSDTAGRCAVAEFVFDLVSLGVGVPLQEDSIYLYSGSHTTTTLRCNGSDDEPATTIFGIADSIRIVTGGPVTARVYRSYCGMGLQCLGVGPSWRASVFLDGPGLELSGYVYDDQIGGGWLRWGEQNTVRASGYVLVRRGEVPE